MAAVPEIKALTNAWIAETQRRVEAGIVGEEEVDLAMATFVSGYLLAHAEAEGRGLNGECRRFFGLVRVIAHATARGVTQ